MQPPSCLSCLCCSDYFITSLRRFQVKLRPCDLVTRTRASSRVARCCGDTPIETGRRKRHAQRIVEAQHRGGEDRGDRPAAVEHRVDGRLLAARPGPGRRRRVLLAIAKVLLDEDLIDREFVRRWVNWRTYLHHRAPGAEPTFENFIVELRREYARYTPRVRRGRERRAGRARSCRSRARSPRAAPAFSSHIWRAAAAGNLHGWQITRALWLLNVLTGCGRAPSAACRPTRGTSSSPRRGASRPPTRSGTSSTGRASTRWRTTR